MGGLIAALYGVVAYVIFLATLLCAVGFVENLGPWKTIDSSAREGLGGAIAVNIALLGVFAVQHSVMARRGFKRWWTKFVPEAVERSTYVLFSSLALILLFAYWRPIPTVLWSVSGAAAWILMGISWLGWAMALVSTFLLSHLEFFGLSQATARFRSRKTPEAGFRTPALYRFVRHPLYLGFLFAFWATPVMTGGHLLFALATTGYLLVGIALEERDLVAQFGEAYRGYRREVPMLLPLPGRVLRSDRAPAIRER